MPILNRIAEFQDDMTAWRRHLHANPELQYDTHETAAFVARKLHEFGVDEVVTGIGRTGVVGIVNGQGPGPTIGLRADMDALPIEEVRDLPWKSKNPGKMHACGHDGHTTMLLGAARYLAETRNFAGRAALIFQPAEEGGAGALAMIEDGLIERFEIAQVYGMHNWPGLETGRIGMRAGTIMAAADHFEIHITGKGAHAAAPHHGVDPVVIGAQMVLALQTLVARETDPLDHAVLSICCFNAGTAHNVIPGKAELKGTVRTLSEETRARMPVRMKQVVEATAAMFGGAARLDYHMGYPSTVNHDDATAFAAEVAADVVGAQMTSTDRPPEMGAEDFSYMLQRRPGAYVHIGQGDTAGLHHPEYDFNDEIAPIGASFFARLVERAQPVAR